MYYIQAVRWNGIDNLQNKIFSSPPNQERTDSRPVKKRKVCRFESRTQPTNF